MPHQSHPPPTCPRKRTTLAKTERSNPLHEAGNCDQDDPTVYRGAQKARRDTREDLGLETRRERALGLVGNLGYDESQREAGPFFESCFFLRRPVHGLLVISTYTVVVSSQRLIWTRISFLCPIHRPRRPNTEAEGED